MVRRRRRKRGRKRGRRRGRKKGRKRGRKKGRAIAFIPNTTCAFPLSLLLCPSVSSLLSFSSSFSFSASSSSASSSSPLFPFLFVFTHQAIGTASQTLGQLVHDFSILPIRIRLAVIPSVTLEIRQCHCRIQIHFRIQIQLIHIHILILIFVDIQRHVAGVLVPYHRRIRPILRRCYRRHHLSAVSVRAIGLVVVGVVVIVIVLHIAWSLRFNTSVIAFAFHTLALRFSRPPS
mmetsp:Transcript_22202/g.39512  ORF Transcript_22202/g.39512 Transcript_22202/m.39512 type:complete len:233 (-) Transcript_22202:46-744(-)